MFSFINNKLCKIEKPTMGIQNYIAYYKLSKRIVVYVQIIDMGGIEKYKLVNNIYYEKAICFLLVYDITNKDSFNDCKNFFLDKIKENCKKDYKILLLGNKSDLEFDREIIPERGSLFALENNFGFKDLVLYLKMFLRLFKV